MLFQIDMNLIRSANIYADIADTIGIVDIGDILLLGTIGQYSYGYREFKPYSIAFSGPYFSITDASHFFNVTFHEPSILLLHKISI